MYVHCVWFLCDRRIICINIHSVICYDPYHLCVVKIYLHIPHTSHSKLSEVKDFLGYDLDWFFYVHSFAGEHTIFKGKFVSAWSHISVCIILVGSCKEEGSSCKACNFACICSLPNSSEEVTWKRFLISFSVKSYFIILSHYSYFLVILDINCRYSRCQFL